ncbi:pyridoxal-phosphate dependent enzyme, partial [Pseudomonas gessardii]|uniref:pyridoxal-phosphate dependent enzyme n=1 Tax=Pseudomonas gessardii TaxID=78544 RepID=UPI001F221292
RVGEPGGGLPTADRDATAERIATEQGAYWTRQHHNPANANGYTQLAAELRAVLGDEIHYLVGAVGTGGSLCGTARALKRHVHDLHVIGVEPCGSVIFGGPGAPYHQSGTGTPEGAEIGAVVDYTLIDKGLTVSDAQAFETARYLARHYGLLLGGSAGGVVYQALREARHAPAHSVIVALVCDGGEKYLDTVFNDQWMADRQLLAPQVHRELGQWLSAVPRLKQQA